MEQNSLPRVRVVNYYINGEKIGRVKSVNFRVAVDEVPTFTFEIVGAPEIDIAGNVRLSFTQETVEESARTIRDELLKHGALYDGFLASIKSALDDYGYETACLQGANAEVAYEVLRRIIGEEKEAGRKAQEKTEKN